MNNNFKISVAQTSSAKGDVSANIETHLGAVQKAADAGVSYIVFPELSLTGFEPQLSAALAFSENDPRLAPLSNAAVDHNIYIAAGAPLRHGGQLYIGEFILLPDGQIETYRKMNLHPGEDNYFSAGTQHHQISLGQFKIFNAICADTNNPQHVQACIDMGASIYAAGVLISEKGYDADTRALERYAKEFNVLVAMANHNRPTGEWVPAGKSAIWDPNGLIAAADQKQDALAVAEHSSSGWNGAVIEI